jgi:cytochrome c
MQASRAAYPSLCLFLLLLAPTLVRAQGAPADGQRLFQTRCGSCHTVQPGQNRIGPSLAGMFGRKAGTAEGARYSDAMRKSDITWNDETLNAYLDNPRGLVPNTTMTVNLRDAAQRSAVIAYLRGLAQPAPTP